MDKQIKGIFLCELPLVSTANACNLNGAEAPTKKSCSSMFFKTFFMSFMSFVVSIKKDLKAKQAPPWKNGARF
ncbi:MAG: hypothetical protein PVH19_13835 [Planctomycetia bacterium]